MRRILFLTILITSFQFANSQNANYRAQGNYYSAKEAYERGNYPKAIEYVEQAKQYLKGTNQQLQYVHTLAAYAAKKYSLAQKEMELFFKIQSGELKPVTFDRSVEQLTIDEVKQITKLIDKIDEGIEAEQIARQKREAERKRQQKATRRPGVIAAINRILEAQMASDTLELRGVLAKRKAFVLTYETYIHQSPLSYYNGRYTFRWTLRHTSYSKTSYDRELSEYKSDGRFISKGFQMNKLASIKLEKREPRSKFTALGLSFTEPFYRTINDRTEKTNGLVIYVLKNRQDEIRKLTELLRELKEIDQ